MVEKVAVVWLTWVFVGESSPSIAWAPGLSGNVKGVGKRVMGSAFYTTKHDEPLTLL